METNTTEATDSVIPEFPLPEQIERFIESGKYEKVEIQVTRANYHRRMHNLLYLEEFKQREDMSRWAWQWVGVAVAACGSGRDSGCGSLYLEKLCYLLLGSQKDSRLLV